MELYKKDNIIGVITEQSNNSNLVQVDYSGTILTLPADENELLNKFDTGGSVPSNNNLEDYETLYNGEIIYHWEHTPNEWYSNDQTFYSLKEVQEYIDSGSPLDERTINAYRHGAFNTGGRLALAEEMYRIDSAHYITGKKITLKMPNGENRDADFAIIELTDILASHNEITFANTIGYPTDEQGDNINDRNYTNDLSAQQRVQQWGNDLDADRLITTSRTPSGTPIIDNNGYVVSGNNRTMSLKLAAANPDKTNYENYINFLVEEIEAFGLKYLGSQGGKYGFEAPDKFTKWFKQPVLVRIDYDIPDLNTLELSKYNKDTKKSEKPIDKAIKLGKILASNENCKSVISSIVGQYDTFTDFYANGNDQKKMINTLLECDILTQQELPSFVEGNGFTSQGKELIENLLAGLVLTKNALIVADQKAKRFRQIIITSLPVLSANSTLGADSLQSPISNAVLLEGTIKSSGLSFDDWIVQQNMFDTPPASETLILNRLLSTGRNSFKRAIEKYNAAILSNKTESLFGDTMSQSEIFEKIITAAILPNDAETIKNLSSTPKKIETPIKLKPEAMPNQFINGNYFTSNPENILAVKSKGVSRYGKPVVIYKGSISDIADIEADENFIEAYSASNPTISVLQKPIEKITDVDVAQIENLEAASNQSAKNQQSKQKRKTTLKTNAPAKSANDNLETLSITECYYSIMDSKGTTLNSQISPEELKVFLWYKIKIGRPILTKEWYDIAETTHDSLSIDDGFQWVKSGLLYYFKDELLPAYLYLSGDIYAKQQRLAASELSKNVGEDAKYIIKNFGEEVYNAQVIALREVFEEKYSKRLLIEGVGSTTGLKLLPKSKFCKNFKIEILADEVPFKMKAISAAANNKFGTPDFFKTNVSENDKTIFDKLSLNHAFCYWLATDKTINYKQGTNFVQIIETYIQGKSKPPTKAIKDIGGGYSGANKVIYDAEVAAFERLKSRTKQEGDRLFSIFLNEQLNVNDKSRVEIQWNRDFNNIVGVNYNKIPVAFRMNKYIGGQLLDVRPEKRDAVAFTTNNGSGLLAYDVGVGKTPSAIFTISQFIDLGYCSRPIVVVPNQTYKQWISEFESFAGHLKINALYNLSDSIIADFKAVNGDTPELPNGSVTIVTYEGMKKIGFNEQTENNLFSSLTAILMQSTEDLSAKKADRAAVKANAKTEALLGVALSRTKLDIEDLGIDYMCLDEAHAAKKVFTNVAGEAEENLGNSGKAVAKKSAYTLSAGTPSGNAIKAFTICQYIQRKTGGNTQLLTATPFTNSPLEIYSMLSMISHRELVKQNLENLNVFFDNFIEVSYEMVINSKMKPQRKQVILGYNNLIVMQDLIRRFISYKTGEEVGVKRPNKIVIPLREELVDNVRMKLPEEKQVDSILPMSALQRELMDKITDYASGGADIACDNTSVGDDNESGEGSEEIDISTDAMDDKEKAGVRVLKALSWSRNLALSPYLFDCSGLGTPTYEQYITTSNKLLYTMECIASIKAHHENNNTPQSGIVIYMDRGVKLFSLIKEWLVKKVGYSDDEVGIISSKLYSPLAKGIKDEDKKEYVKNLFLGKKFNKATLLLERVPDDKRIKVLIGSSTIKEGINLQEYSATLFNLFLPWNITDIQQLEGRIYRQKNAFANVRIVNPLMIDSIDVFMFQKLEEKASRINTIWESDGRTNVLKTQDFNPSELKYRLIKDARIIAEIEVLEEREKLEEKVADLANKVILHDQIKEYNDTINEQTNPMWRWLAEYRPEKRGNMPPERGEQQDLKVAAKIMNLIKVVLKTQKDKDGLPMERTWGNFRTDKKILETTGYSKLSPADKPWQLDKFTKAISSIKRFQETYLIPNELNILDLDKINASIQKQIEQTQEEQKLLSSDENISIKVKAIEAKRAEENIVEKPFKEVVNEFKRLNYLLDDVKTIAPTPAAIVCPPLDSNGLPAIDPVSLKQLDECLKSEPDTKLLHSIEIENADGVSQMVYTPQRLKLHNKIIKHLTKNAICIKNEQPIAVLMGGSAGSGKSTFLKKNAKYMTSDKIWAVDADEVRSMLPEYKGYNSAATHPETQDIVRKLLQNYDNPCKHDLLFDGTMNNINKYKTIIRQLKTLGYKIFIAFMDIPKEVAIERALNRYRDNRGKEAEFGRYVPIKVIDEFFATGDEGFQALKSDVTGFIKIDSLTGKVLEQGGEDIPATRSYSKIFADAEKTIREDLGTKPPADKRNNLESAISAVKLLINYQPDNSSKRKNYESKLAAMNISLKYLK